MKIKNIDEVDNWLWEHAYVMGHTCTGIKNKIGLDDVNIAYIDEDTHEKIDIEYEI